MEFKQYLESVIGNNWLELQGMGYTLQIKQYSNKGPLIIVQDPDGKELGRTRFDLFTNRWTTND